MTEVHQAREVDCFFFLSSHIENFGLGLNPLFVPSNPFNFAAQELLGEVVVVNLFFLCKPYVAGTQ